MSHAQARYWNWNIKGALGVNDLWYVFNEFVVLRVPEIAISNDSHDFVNHALNLDLNLKSLQQILIP